MSIQSEISRLTKAVSDAYAEVANKGGTIPTSAVSRNLASAIASIPEASGGGGLPEGLAAVSVGTYTPASETAPNAALIPHDLGDVPDFAVMYVDETVILSDFAAHITAFACVTVSGEDGLGAFYTRYVNSAGSKTNGSGGTLYASAVTTTTFRISQTSSYQLKAGSTYKFVVGKFA